MKYLVVMALVALCMSCAPQSSDIQAARKTVDLYLDYQNAHYFDHQWRRSNLQSLFHPDFVDLGETGDYSFSTKDVKTLPGENLFLSSAVLTVTKGKEHIDFSKPAETLDDVYIAQVKYRIIATSPNGQIVFRKEPFDYVVYIVLAKDPSDGMIKVVDTYPTTKAIFINAKYLIRNLDAYTDNQDQIKKIRADITATYGTQGLDQIK